MKKQSATATRVRRDRKGRRTLLHASDITADLWGLLYGYRWRLGMALLFLILAKVTTVWVPLMLKRIIDQLSHPENLGALPFYLLIGYAVLRFSSTLFNELRDLLFARVSQNTVAT